MIRKFIAIAALCLAASMARDPLTNGGRRKPITAEGRSKPDALQLFAYVVERATQIEQRHNRR